jgi:hypothetical protein
VLPPSFIKGRQNWIKWTIEKGLKYRTLYLIDWYIFPSSNQRAKYSRTSSRFASNFRWKLAVRWILTSGLVWSWAQGKKKVQVWVLVLLPILVCSIGFLGDLKLQFWRVKMERR